MLDQIFRKKELTENENTQLKRCLSAFDLTLLGVGCIIGTGIFVLTGIVAATHSGPAIIISFIIAGTACAFAALSYAELSSLLEVVEVLMAIPTSHLVNFLHGLLAGYSY